MMNCRGWALATCVVLCSSVSSAQYCPAFPVPGGCGQSGPRLQGDPLDVAAYCAFKLKTLLPQMKYSPP